MNKAENPKERIKSLSLSALEDILTYILEDEILLGYKEGETKLDPRHSAWQLAEEQAASAYLKGVVESAIENQKEVTKGTF